MLPNYPRFSTPLPHLKILFRRELRLSPSRDLPWLSCVCDVLHSIHHWYEWVILWVNLNLQSAFGSFASSDHRIILVNFQHILTTASGSTSAFPPWYERIIESMWLSNLWTIWVSTRNNAILYKKNKISLIFGYLNIFLINTYLRYLNIEFKDSCRLAIPRK